MGLKWLSAVSNEGFCSDGGEPKISVRSKNGVAPYVPEVPATVSYSKFQNYIIIEINSATEMLLHAV
jgi:hypothetical protein